MERLTPAQRSANMARIKGKDTKPELTVRRLLHAAGYRYRLHGRYRNISLPGRPDLVFARDRKVIFVNGCFWHSHSCPAGQHAPRNNAEFWAAKRARTVARDAEQLDALADLGWEALVLWECQLKDRSTLDQQIRQFLPRGALPRGGLPAPPYPLGPAPPYP